MGVMEWSRVGVAVGAYGVCYLECLGISRGDGAYLGEAIGELMLLLEGLNLGV